MTTVPLLALADERFISLTTFRRSGVPVSTPVWVTRDGAALVVIAPADSGKVKRLRNDARVKVRPCGRFGQVADGVEPVPGTAVVESDPSTVEHVRKAIRDAYPIEFRITMAIERAIGQVRGKDRTTRVALRISPV